MNPGDIIVLGDKSAIVMELNTNNDGVRYAIAQWHDPQSDGKQFIAIRLDTFKAEEVMPS